MKKRGYLALCLVVSLLMLVLASCDNTPATSTPESTSPQSSTPSQAPDSSDTSVPSSNPEVSDPSSDPEVSNPEVSNPEVSNPEVSDPSTDPDPDVSDPGPTDIGAAVAAKAQSLLGTPFRMGGAGPDEFDNSGFVYYCFKENGVNIPRLTTNMFKEGTVVEKEDLQPGDVVFFYMGKEGAAQFTGIYVGNQTFISCNNENSPTKEQKLNWPYYTKRFVGARRYA